MEEINVISYVSTEALILIPVLFILGKMFKGIPAIKDWTIPYILLVISLALATLKFGFNVDAAIQAILATGVSVLGNEFIKQATKKKHEDNRF